MRARRVNRCYEIAHAFRAVGLSRCATVVSQRKLSGIDAVRLDEASWIKMFRASASPFLMPSTVGTLAPPRSIAPAAQRAR
jgi:hypothetical protein